ncbi:ATP phosphoribosyltransferase regulatory subunit [Halalkalibacillus halophilus]|uniref:ATP phosphoribosyltransferase regulatory subunit n=1 Tax=Halalkalibacillus halophilus TaxID=392827 RepID=UPI000417CBA7|nr:ATP phosphoribosyltransferase regulatory subunit [Halalkalibacillus halophilus]
MDQGQSLPRGVTDLYAKDYLRKERVIDNLKQLLHTNGFQPIQTPTFEYYDLFLSIPGKINPDRMIKMIDHDGKILVLRPDATIPIARMAASAQLDVNDFHKLSYVTNVFRMNNGESDVFSRSFTQVGVEQFDQGEAIHDLEMIVLAIDSLLTSGMENIYLELGQAGFFKGLMKEVDLTEAEQFELQQLIEQKNQAEIKRKVEALNIKKEVADVIVALPQLFGQVEQVVTQAKPLCLNNEMSETLSHITFLSEQLIELGYDRYVSVDLGLINDFQYYTGTIFQGFVEGYGKSVIQGGRYDALTEHFDMETSAIGFGVYVDDLIAILNQGNILTEGQSTSVSIYPDSNQAAAAIKLAKQLREAGVVAEIRSNTSSIPEAGNVINLNDGSFKLQGSKSKPIPSISDVVNEVTQHGK